jgi:hypothetical protein
MSSYDAKKTARRKLDTMGTQEAPIRNPDG